MKRFYRPVLFCAMTCFCTSVFARETLPILWNVPHESDAYYGRNEDLKDAKERIRRNPLLVTGRSGIGKTSFAFHYARSNAQEYQVVWVLNASKGIEDQIIDFANKLSSLAEKKLSFKKYEEALDYLKTHLRLSSFGWLLIIDNAPSLQSVVELVPETHGARNKHILITSLSSEESSQTLRLDALKNKEAWAFLAHHLPTANSLDIECLANLLENHPLAMLQAASYIKATPSMDIKEYISFFNENKKKYWVSEEKALKESTHPLLYKAIKVSLDQLKENSPESYNVFSFLCLLDTQKMNKFLVEKAYQVSSADPAEFKRLLSLSLIMQDTSFDRNLSYKIQEYTKDVVLYSLSPDDLKNASILGLKLFKSLLAGNVMQAAQTFQKYPSLRIHLMYFLSQADLMSGDDVLEMGVKLFYYTYYFLRDESACLEISEMLKPYVRSGKISQLSYLVLYQSLDSYMTALKQNVPTALKELRLAKAQLETFSKSDQSRILAEVITPAAYFSYLQGDMAALKASLLELNKPLRPEEEIKETFIEELTLYYIEDKGKIKKALECADQILLSKKKSTTLQIEIAKTILLIKDKKYEEAYNLTQHIEKLLKSENIALETETWARLLMARAFAQTFLHQGKLAEHNAKKAIDALTKVCMGREKKRLQAFAHTILGGVYQEQKRYKEALAEYTYAERIYAKVCTHKNFDDMSDLYHRFVTLGILMNDINVVKKAIFSHKESFDTLHPRYLEMTKLTLKAGLSL